MNEGSRKLQLIGGIEERKIQILDYDPHWPEIYKLHENKIAWLLGDIALQIEHIGSTSVPGLAAKPIIDILLVVDNSANEAMYLPKMESAGYQLRVREPDFYEHRMLRTPEKDVQIHVYSKDSPEIDRCITFRDRLRRNEPDRLLYELTKRRLASQTWPDMNAYASAKSKVIESIIAAGCHKNNSL